MKKADSVSIIIPVFNEENFIVDCLESIADQSVQPDEVILVDNNSTDKTVDLAKSYKFVRVVTEYEQGRGAARRKGFDEARSEILARIDADSRLNNRWVEHLKRDIQDYDAITGPVEANDGSFKKLTTSTFNFFTFNLNKLISGHQITFGANMAIRSSEWNKHKKNILDSERYWEDLAIACELNKHGNTIGFSKNLISKISIRSTDNVAAGVGQLMGWPRTYWRYNKIASVLAFISGLIGGLLVLLVWPFIHFKYDFKQRG